MVSHYASKKNIAVEIKPIDKRYHKLFEQVYSDQSRMAQVLINLLSNSIKFSPRESEVQIKIKVQEIQFTNKPLLEIIQEESKELSNPNERISYVKF
jgi:signal transduction histidine kinase